MTKRPYGTEYVRGLEQEVGILREKIIAVGNQIGYVLKEVGSSPVELMAMGDGKIDTSMLLDGESVLGMNLSKLINVTLRKAGESKEFKEALKVFGENYKKLEKEMKEWKEKFGKYDLKKPEDIEKIYEGVVEFKRAYHKLYKELAGVQEVSSEKEKKLAERVRKIARRANEAIVQLEQVESEKEDLERMHLEVYTDEAKKAVDDLLYEEISEIHVEPILLSDTQVVEISKIKDLQTKVYDLAQGANKVLGENEELERSRRSLAGWNTRYREEIRKLEEKVKDYHKLRKGIVKLGGIDEEAINAWLAENQ